jgi:hypothetical protein
MPPFARSSSCSPPSDVMINDDQWILFIKRQTSKSNARDKQAALCIWGGRRGGVSSGPGETKTILPLHFISQ